VYDAVVVGIRDVHVPVTVNEDALRVLESLARTSEHAYAFIIRIKLYDPVVTRIYDVKIVVIVDEQVLRLLESVLPVFVCSDVVDGL
jgi:hypothetical protein